MKVITGDALVEQMRTRCPAENAPIIAIISASDDRRQYEEETNYTER